MSMMNDGGDDDAAADQAVSAALSDASDALDAAIEAQRADPGNASDPNDQAVMSGLVAAKARISDVAAAQQRDMEGPG
jgi:hypothetical protein